MSASPGSPSREAAPEAATPETIQRPAQRQRLAPRDCSRCGTVHAPNCCTLPLAKGIGKVFHAGLPGACQICFQAFETTGETKDRSLILSFMEQGYCHRDCVVKMLKPYYGPEAKPLLQRLEEALVGQTQAIQEFVRRAILDVEFLKKAYEICKAAPGAGKTLALSLIAAILGPMECLNVSYNLDAATGLRERGAPNSSTLNSLGARAVSRCVINSIKERRNLKEFTYDEAPLSLQFTLITDDKVSMIVHYLNPPQEDDGVGAKVSLIFKVFGKFVTALYEAAATRAFGVVGYPAMDDIGALSRLVHDLDLSGKYIITAMGTLTPLEVKRLNAVCNTSEARIIAGCMMISQIHVASLTILTNPLWILPNSTKILQMRHPITGKVYRLPAGSFLEQITGAIYNPQLIKPIQGCYKLIQEDEFQDNSESRALFMQLLAESSDANAGNRAHFTFLRLVGDPDQAVTGWSGGLLDAPTRMGEILHARVLTKMQNSPIELTLEECEGAVTSLPVSLRCPVSHINLANEAYDNAYGEGGYASDAISKPDPERTTRMVPKDGAIEGVIVQDATFGKEGEYLMGLVEECNPSERVGTLFRRGLDASDVSEVLTLYGFAHILALADKKLTPMTHIRAPLRLLVQMSDAPEPDADAPPPPPGTLLRSTTVSDLLINLPIGGVVGVIDGMRASCIRKLASELAPTASMHDLMAHAEYRFSSFECSRLRLTTAHAAKGQTFRTTVICQPQLFPLERNVTEGGIGLVQEPKVEYVALTRATHRIVFMVEADNSHQDTSYETLYFEL